MKYKLLRFSLLSIMAMLWGTVFADSYQKVTSSSDLVDGQYLIVYEGNDTHAAVALNGSLETLDAANNGIAVTISDNTISSTTELDAAAFTIDVAAGTIQSSTGNYIGASSYANTLKTATSADTYKNAISIENDGSAVIGITFTGGTVTMRYNYANDQLRFRYYKSGQQPVALYKKDTGGQTDTRVATTVTLGDHATTGEVGGTLSLPTATVTANGSAISNAQVTWTSSNETVATISGSTINLLTAGTTTIKASYEGDNANKPSSASFTLTVTPAAVAITSFAELQAKVTSDNTPAAITFNGEQVVYVNGSNAFLADATGKGALIYTKNHGLEAGQTLTGTISATITLYQGNAEITGFSTEGLTIGTADVTPTLTAVGSITAANQSTLVTIKNVTYSQETECFTDANGASIKYYDKFKAKAEIEEDKAYDVTGIVVMYNDLIEICPRTAEDVVEATGDTPEEWVWRDFAVRLSDGSVPTDTKTFGVKVAEDGTYTAVDANDDTANFVFNGGRFNDAQHGWENVNITMKVNGPVLIKLGDCQHGAQTGTITDAAGNVTPLAKAAKKCWDPNAPDQNVVATYYRGLEPTTLTIDFKGYCPFFSATAIAPEDLPAEVTEYTVTFQKQDDIEGMVPTELTVKEGEAIVLPANRTLYKKDYTMTAWTDGTTQYKPGDEMTITANTTLTAVFTENDIEDPELGETFTAIWDFQQKNGAPVLSYEGNKGIYVTQVDFGGYTVDMKLDFDTSTGKINNANWQDWCQMNSGTKLTIPALKGMTVSLESYNATTTTTVAGSTEHTSEGNIATYTYEGKDKTIDIVIGDGSYFRYVKVVYPVNDDEDIFPLTGTWDFTDANIVAAVTALSGTTEPGEIDAMEDNGLKLTVEANGQTIRNNGNSIQTGNPVVFKVPVQGTKDVVTVVGYSQPYFAYSVAGTDATEATTIYTATAADVEQGYVEVVNKGQYLISISVTQNENDDQPEAQDITGTWSYGDAGVMDATMAFSGTNEPGEVEAVEKNGLMMTVEANGATFRNNGNNIQVRTGAVFKIPVKNAGDLVTVKGYTGYSYYTIGNSTEVLNNENTYKAKISDAEAGYVAVTSMNDNNYYLALSVTQYAPKEKITLDNEMATVTFPFNEGTEGQKATFSNADYFLNSKVTYGSNLTLKDKYSIADAELSTDDNQVMVVQTRFEPSAKLDKADEASAVRFMFTPKPGFSFVPTKVALNVTRYGTDNGLVDVTWEVANGENIVLATGVKPARNNGKPNITKVSYDITNATATEGPQSLLVHLYSLQEAKQFGINDIVIEGILNGTEKDVPILASFKVNGNEYAVEEVFGEAYEATLELPKTEKMVGKDNPLTDVTASSGDVGEISYEEKDNACIVTIPMTAGDTQMDYVLNVVFKPDFTLSYLDVDGKVIGTQTVEKDAAIGEFAYDIANVPATKEGYKARGWFKKAVLGEKFTTADIITANTNLYAIQTEIEEASTHKKYNFDLTNKFFYAEDHEAFNPAGEGFYWHDAQHGWAFKPGNTIDLLVGPKATVTVTLCQYGYATGIDVKKGGETLATLPGMSDGDGGTAVFNYEGEAGTITLELQGTGEMYIHGVKIVNTSEVNFESEGNWYFVKAGDAGSLIDVIDVVNGINASKDAGRAFIFLPDGTYDLDATVKTAITGNNISIIGQSMDKTIIVSKPDKSQEGLGQADLLQNSGTNLYLQDLTLKNALDYYNAGSAGRAPAFADAGNRTIGKNVRMLSYQDTYYSSNSSQQAYWENSDIHGTVDFICGGGDIRFQNTTISLEPRQASGKGGRTIVAPTTTTQFGYVFDGCTVVDLANGQGDWNFGRTWQNEPISVYLNTTLDDNAKNTLVASRWTQKGMNNKDPKLFGEYGTKDMNGTDITPASNKISSFGGTFETIISADKAAEFAYSKMFTDWDPATLARQLEAPANAKYDNGTVTWTPANNGAIAYMLEKNGEFVAITTESTFNITVDAAKDALTIRAANAQGGFGKAAAVAGTASAINSVKTATGNEPVYNLQGVRVNKIQKGVYIQGGRKVIVK